METTLVHSLPTDERTLVRRAQAGDIEAFGALVSQYMRRAYYAALGLVGSHDDALDLSQEAFSRAFPPQEIWDTYWTSVYRRFERGVGWVLLSLGAIVSLSYGLWKAAQEILADTTIPGFIKGAILLAIVGVVVLFVSVAREKWFAYRSDPYKDIQR